MFILLSIKIHSQMLIKEWLKKVRIRLLARI